MNKEHLYQSSIVWTGNKGQGTKNYTAYERSYTIHTQEKMNIEGSSDPSFRGDQKKHNPEDLFLASISSCHMLWYLHVCAINNIIVVEYTDHAEGKMVETERNGGHFTEVILHPVVTITDVSQIDLANALHHEANKHCFIANSLNFKVNHKPVCKVMGESNFTD